MGFAHILISHLLPLLCSLPFSSQIETTLATITNDLLRVVKLNTHVFFFILLSLSMALDKTGLKSWDLWSSRTFGYACIAICYSSSSPWLKDQHCSGFNTGAPSSSFPFPPCSMFDFHLIQKLSESDSTRQSDHEICLFSSCTREEAGSVLPEGGRSAWS